VAKKIQKQLKEIQKNSKKTKTDMWHVTLIIFFWKRLNWDIFSKVETQL